MVLDSEFTVLGSGPDGVEFSGKAFEKEQNPPTEDKLRNHNSMTFDRRN